MAVLRWRDPFESNLFRELGRFQEEMNTLFNRFVGRRSLLSTAGVFPPVNVSHDHDNIYVTAELPGVPPETLDITVEDDTLVIRGERKPEPEAEKVSYHRREREMGAFSRSISLPTRVAAEKTTASTKDGVLKLVLPKVEEVKPRKVDIQVG